MPNLCKHAICACVLCLFWLRMCLLWELLKQGVIFFCTPPGQDYPFQIGIAASCSIIISTLVTATVSLSYCVQRRSVRLCTCTGTIGGSCSEQVWSSFRANVANSSLLYVVFVCFVLFLLNCLKEKKLDPLVLVCSSYKFLQYEMAQTLIPCFHCILLNHNIDHEVVMWSEGRRPFVGLYLCALWLHTSFSAPKGKQEAWPLHPSSPSSSSSLAQVRSLHNRLMLP